MVEQWTENPCVPGSIPGGTTINARMVKLVDTLDLKSSEQQCSCGFKSRSEYKKLQSANVGGSFFCLLIFIKITATISEILPASHSRKC
jgi:hypothetical protein